MPDTSGPEKSSSERPAGRAGRRHRGLHAAAVQRGARRRTPTCSSTTSSSPCATVPGRGAGAHVRAWSPRSAPGTRAPRSAPTSSSSPTACCPPQVQEIAEVTTTRVEPEVLRAAAARARSPTGPPARSAPRRCTSTRWTARSPVGLGRDGDPIYLNLEFLDGTRGGHVSISGISRRRHQDQLRALPAVLDLQPAARSATRSVNAKALVFSVKGEDLLFLDHANRRLDDDLRADYAHARAARRRRSPRSGFFAPPTPDDLTRPPARHRPHQRRHRVLVDARRVLRRRAAALRLRRRRGRAQPVHDGHPPGGGPAAPGGRRRPADGAVVDRGPDPAHLRRPGRVRLRPAHATTTPAATGRARSPAPARSTPSCGGCGRSLKPLRSIVRGDLPDTPARRVTHRGPAGHGRRPAQPPRARPAVRRRRRARGRDGAQGGRGRGRAAVHDDRRAEQVRPARGRQPDQGGAARHRRARPVAGHHPHRRAADGERGGAADRVQLVDQGGRPAGPGRGGAARSTGSCRRRSGRARCWPSRARCSSPSPRSRCRWPSSSRSRRGRRGESEMGAAPVAAGVGHATVPAGAARDPFARLPAVDDDPPSELPTRRTVHGDRPARRELHLARRPGGDRGAAHPRRHHRRGRRAWAGSA